ncbi:MAG: hypothetical protein ACKOSQ_11775 [Planctomycetaceae bacterium]
MIGRSACVVVAITLAAASAAEPDALDFHRVHGPAGRIGEVPLGGERLVPMPLADFEAAVARARAAVDARGANAPAPSATAARWRAALDESGVLVGTVSCDVGPTTAGPGRTLPLGDLRARRGLRAGDPPREALICGLGAGLALVVPEPGTYDFEFSCPPGPADGRSFRLPLVPSLATSLVLDLPAGSGPVLSGPAARRAIVTPPRGGSGPWRIEVGPAAELVLTIAPLERGPPGVAIWAEVGLAGPRATLAAVIVPEAPWRAGRLVLEQDPSLRMTAVRAADDDEPLDHDTGGDGRTVTIVLPRWLDGRRTPLVVRGVAPATGPVWRLPLVRAAGGAWAGGGTIVHVDPAFVVRDVELEECRVVPAEAAAEWPRATGSAPDDAGAGRAAAYHVEQQGPAAVLGVELGLRAASFDVARVTTVDIAPGALLGRAACDLRVTGGEAFEITARVAAGWIIDAVDAVDWQAAADELAPRAVEPADRVIDWRVEPSPVGATLRIGLAAAASGRRGVGLRVTGHRAGVVPGAPFTTADIDMVRFDGEAADAAVIDLRTAADEFIEIAGRPAGWFEAEGRLVPLVEPGKARGRIRAGDRTPDGEARLVRSRPPLDVRVDVRLEPRDDALVQTFLFDCRSAAGVESLVVDFAEPGGDGLAWQVESPAGVTAVARPLEPAEGGLASRSDAIAASYLVELNPAPRGPVRIRATRAVPFTATVPVPLAWVEGAEETGGTVRVAVPVGARPRLVNHRLRELPVDAGADGPVEFAYDGPLPGAAAELAPAAAGADARAWAWRETVSVWCDASGATETESRFDVENEGRGSLSLSLSPGRRLEKVLVDGADVPGVEFGSAGGAWRIPLPPARRRLELVVRTLVAGRADRGAWRVDPEGCGLDLPVLDRDVRLLLPPDLVIVSPAAPERLPWTARLLGVGASAPDDGAAGYRVEPVAATADRRGGVLVVRRGLLVGAAILAACGAGIVGFMLARGRPATAGLFAVAAAVAALWVPVPLVAVARAAWWGALAGLACAAGPRAAPRTWRSRRAALAAACTVAMVAASRPAVATDAGLRVFVTPGAGGDTALVPEPLFRALAASAMPEAAAIRVVACRIIAESTAAGATWRMTLDIDADAGGTLALDAGRGAAWQPLPAGAAAVTAVVSGREARLTARAAGRHAVELAVVPAVERRGPVETATIGIPVAPTATIEVGDVSVGTLDCERAVGGGAFVSVAPVATGGGITFDVSPADRVRIVRPADPRDRLAATVRAADTVNDLSWEQGGCGVSATVELDAGQDLLRSFSVQVDPRLEGLVVRPADGAPPRLVPLGGGRVLVELPEAVRGRVRVGLAARLPLADPVGVFDVAGIWLAGVPAETRTIRLSAADEFDALLDPPPPAGATAAELTGRLPTRVTVRRRRPQIRGAQSLAVAFAPTGTTLALQAQIDAGARALARITIDVPVGCAVDRVALVADELAEPGAREDIDIVWTRTAADRLLVVVQRPRPGRFRLAVDARLARRPAPRGRLPVVRAGLGPAVPLLVAWSAEPPLVVRVQTPSGGSGQPDAVEVPDGAGAPEYEMAAEPAPAAPAPVETAATAGVESARMERAEVRVACDGRGRIHGLARFDLVAETPTVRLRLPPGMRLFDVLVDGRVVAAEPRAADAWDIPLGIVPWPRTILAVLAGDAGTALGAGRPLSLEPPRVEGLPAAEVLWSLEPPAGYELRVAPPARPLDGVALEAARAAARDRVAEACAWLAAGASGMERDRLEMLASLRREDRGPATEEAWWHAGPWRDAAGCSPTFVAAAGEEPLVIRAVPAADDTAFARAVATVALVVAGGLVWTAAARQRSRAVPASEDRAACRA